MEQGQDLARAAADIFVRLCGGLAVGSPTAARVRHSLERTGLILAPHRQAKTGTLRVIPSRIMIDPLRSSDFGGTSAFTGAKMGQCLGELV